jgi:hypothetical protein
MMNSDYKTAKLLFEDKLREAEQRRLQQQAERDAELHNQRAARSAVSMSHADQRSAVERIILRLRAQES